MINSNDKQNIKQKTITNWLWRFAERCGAQGVSFIVSIVLARLLTPDIYGTVALVTVFSSILSVFIDSGMGTALIQKKDADDIDFSTLFFFNVLMCVGLYALLFFAAPYIAAFYSNESLTSVIRVLGLTLILAGVKSIQNAYVSKHLLFRKFFFSTLGGTLFSAVVGIIMAYLGFGVWALVAQQLTNTAIDTLILWITVRWRPKRKFKFSRLKQLFSFGWKLLVSNLLDTGYNNLRSLIIGKKYSSEDLAYYNKGQSFPDVIVTNINASINSVLFPTLAAEQNDVARVKSMTRRAIKTSTYIMAPMMIGLAVIAKPLVSLLLTDKWLDCVLFLQIFCVSYLFFPIHTANLSAINALGRSDYFLKLEIIKKIVGLTAIIITMWISVEAMAYSLLLTTIISTIINAYPNKKLLNYSWFEQMKDILPHIALALAMGIPVFFMQFIALPTIVILLLQIITGGLIYIGLSYLLKVEMFTYLLDIVKDFFKNRKSKKTSKFEDDNENINN